MFDQALLSHTIEQMNWAPKSDPMVQLPFLRHVPALGTVFEYHRSKNDGNNFRKLVASMQGAVFDRTGLRIGDKLSEVHNAINEHPSLFTAFTLLSTLAMTANISKDGERSVADICAEVAFSIPACVWTADQIFTTASAYLDRQLTDYPKVLQLEQMPGEKEMLYEDLRYVARNLQSSMTNHRENQRMPIEKRNSTIFELVNAFVKNRVGIKKPTSSTKRVKQRSPIEVSRNARSGMMSGGSHTALTGEVSVGSLWETIDTYSTVHELLHAFGFGDEAFVETATVLALTESDDEYLRMVGYSNWARKLLIAINLPSGEQNVPKCLEILYSAGISSDRLSELGIYKNVESNKQEGVVGDRTLTGKLNGLLRFLTQMDKRRKNEMAQRNFAGYEQYTRIPCLMLHQVIRS